MMARLRALLFWFLVASAATPAAGQGVGQVAHIVLMNEVQASELESEENPLQITLDTSREWGVSAELRALLVNPRFDRLDETLDRFSDLPVPPRTLLLHLRGKGVYLEGDDGPRMLLRRYRFNEKHDAATAERRLRRGSLALTEVLEATSLSGIDRVLVIYDACHPDALDAPARETIPSLAAAPCPAVPIEGATVLYVAPETDPKELGDVLAGQNLATLFDTDTLREVFGSGEYGTLVFSPGTPGADMDRASAPVADDGEGVATDTAPSGDEDEGKGAVIAFDAKPQDAVRDAWSRAEDLRTCEAYWRFGREFPTAFQTMMFQPGRLQNACEPGELEALKAQDEAPADPADDAWAMLETGGSCDALADFVDRFPDNENAADAQARIDDDCAPEEKIVAIASSANALARNAWAIAEESASCEGYKAFGRDFPDSFTTTMLLPGRLQENCTEAELNASEPADDPQGDASGTDWAALERNPTCKGYREFGRAFPDASNTRDLLSGRLAEYCPAQEPTQPTILAESAARLLPLDGDGARREQVHALALVTPRYRNPALSDLDLDGTVDAFARLADRLGVPAQQARVLGPASRETQRAAVLQLAGAMGRDDEAIVYLAGHVLSDRQRGRTWVLPYDFEFDTLEPRAKNRREFEASVLSLEEIAAILSPRAPLRVLFIVGQCGAAPKPDVASGIDLWPYLNDETGCGAPDLGSEFIVLNGSSALDDAEAPRDLLDALDRAVEDAPSLQMRAIRDMLLSHIPAAGLRETRLGVPFLTLPDGAGEDHLLDCFVPERRGDDLWCRDDDGTLVSAGLRPLPAEEPAPRDPVVEAWTTAREQDSCAAYGAFLREFPDAPQGDQARRARGEACFRERAFAATALCDTQGASPYTLRREGMRALQQELLDNACWPGTVDGYWGGNTATGLRQFLQVAGVDDLQTAGLSSFENPFPSCLTLFLLEDYDGARGQCALRCPDGLEAREGTCVRPEPEPPVPAVEAPEPEPAPPVAEIEPPVAPAPAPVPAPVAAAPVPAAPVLAAIEPAAPLAPRDIDVTSIGFVGNRAFDDGRLRSIIRTRIGDPSDITETNRRFDPRRLEQDRDLIRGLYIESGYYDVTVQGASDVAPGRTGVLLTYTITEGPRYTFDSVILSANLDTDVQTALFAVSPIRSGTPYDRDLIDRTLSRMEALLEDRGFTSISTALLSSDVDRATKMVALTISLRAMAPPVVEEPPAPPVAAISEPVDIPLPTTPYVAPEPTEYVAPVVEPTAPTQYIAPVVVTPTAPTQPYVAPVAAPPVATQQYVAPVAAPPVATQQYVAPVVAPPAPPVAAQQYVAPVVASPAPVQRYVAPAPVVAPTPASAALRTPTPVVTPPRPAAVARPVTVRPPAPAPTPPPVSARAAPAPAAPAPVVQRQTCTPLQQPDGRGGCQAKAPSFTLF